jgi:hypothetical protein
MENNQIQTQIDDTVSIAVGNDPKVAPNIDGEKALRDKRELGKKAGKGMDLNPNAGLLSNFVSNFKKNYNAKDDPDTVKKIEDLVDWDKLKEYGLSKDYLKKSGNLDKMLHGEKSNLVPIKVDFDGVKIESQARLSFVQDDTTGKIGFKFNSLKNERKLDHYFDYNLTDQDRQNLKNTGNLGKVIDVEFPNSNGEKTPVFLSLDKQTNELIAYRAQNVKIPTKLGGIELSGEQQQALSEGKAVRMDGLVNSKTGNTYSSSLQFSATEKRFVFIRQGIDLVPEKIGGVELSDDQRKKISEGTAVKVEKMTDKNGKQYSAHVRYNDQKGKLDFLKWNPNERQSNNQQRSNKQQQPKNQQRPNSQPRPRTSVPRKVKL